MRHVGIVFRSIRQCCVHSPAAFFAASAVAAAACDQFGSIVSRTEHRECVVVGCASAARILIWLEVRSRRFSLIIWMMMGVVQAADAFKVNAYCEVSCWNYSMPRLHKQVCAVQHSLHTKTLSSDILLALIWFWFVSLFLILCIYFFDS